MSLVVQSETIRLNIIAVEFLCIFCISVVAVFYFLLIQLYVCIRYVIF